ncbi:MAG TPA: hypothetical protein GX707_06360 [Epulopiscium sp.]|nr:hypothetical protein [Candidatus Epulonipiscium sp.]
MLVSSVIEQMKNKGVESVSQSDVKETFLMLINLELLEIKELVKDERQPAIVRIVGKEMLSGKGFNIIERMLDRALGKPDSKIDHTSTDGSMSPKAIEVTVRKSDENKT